MPFLGVCRAAYDYTSQEQDELDLRQNDICYILEKDDADWWRVRRKTNAGESGGELDGIVPSSYLEEVR
jgi:hypothetical protein